MDENNNFTPYDDFTDTGYDAVTDAANQLNDAATDAIDTFAGISTEPAEPAFAKPDPFSSATPTPPAAGPDPVTAEPTPAPQPRQRNYERYMNEGTWQPTDQPQPFGDAGAGGGIGGGFDNFGNSYQNNQYTSTSPLQPDLTPTGIPEGLEEPVSMGEWVVCILLMMVPCVNIVMMFVWAFSKTEKKSKSNFFKVELIFMGIILALYLIIILVAVFAGMATAFR